MPKQNILHRWLYAASILLFASGMASSQSRLKSNSGLVQTSKNQTAICKISAPSGAHPKGNENENDGRA